MRVIEKKISDAVFANKSFSGGNTVVHTDGCKTECILHGNKIFQLNRKTNEFKWHDCGWTTHITLSRLNACFDAVHALTGKTYRYSRVHDVGHVFRLDCKRHDEVACSRDF